MFTLQQNLLMLLAMIACGIYNITVFWFIKEILTGFRYSKFYYIVTSVVNSCFYGIVTYIGLDSVLIYILLFALLFLEMVIFFKDKLLKILLGVSCFILNIACIRAILVPVTAIIINKNIYDVVNDLSLNLTLTIILMMIASLYLVIFSRFITTENISILTTNKYQLTFVTAVTTLVAFYMIVNGIIYSFDVEYSLLSILEIKIALVGITAFFLVIMHTMKMAKLEHLKKQTDILQTKIIENEENELALSEIAHTDAMTNIYNRRYGLEQLENMVSNNNSGFAVGFIDLDNLKAVNDNYGHNEGDKYIKTVVKCILRSIRTNDVFCRMGGDEFVIIFKYCDQYEAEGILLRAVEMISTYKEQQYKMSISFGVVDVKAKTKLTGMQIIEQADAKMYAAKQLKKGQQISG